jgi:uncharacterized protein YjdB
VALANGSYTATVEVNDGNQHTASGSATVTVADCSGLRQTAAAVSDRFGELPE